MNFYTPKEITSNSLSVWAGKCNLSISNMIALGILAGAYIAFGAEGSTMAAHDITSVGLARLITGAVFSVGLIMVIICGAELFTGNVLIWIGYLEKKISIGQLLRNWCWVYIANFIGALIVAGLMYMSNLWTFNNGLLGASALKIAVGKVNLTFWQALARGIFCNWLVCLAVWMAFAAKDVIGKIFGIFLPIMLFVTSNFEHSVANMYYISAGLMAKSIPTVVAASKLGAQVNSLTVQSFLLNNLLPVTLGNIIGGGLFVASFYWFAYLRREGTAKQEINIGTAQPTGK